MAGPSEPTTFEHTCLNCCVRFADASMWRDHYKTDWHRYNLKRSVAELAPVTAEEFQKRILAQRELAAGSPKTAQYCKHCRKQFGSAKSYANHLNSRAHRDSVERTEVDAVVGVQLAAQEAELDRLTEEQTLRQQELLEAKQTRREAIDPEDALDSDDIADADDDVEEVDSDEWEDEEGAEEGAATDGARQQQEWHIDNPIVHNKCLFCGHRSPTLVDNVQHMSAVHSFFVPDADYVVDLEGLLRYLGEKVAADYMCLWCNDRGRTFFSLDAARKHMRDKGHCRMLHEGLALAEYAEFYDYSSSYPDNSDDMDIDAELPEADALDAGEEYQLVLPSGAVIGHRSLLRYYKQRLNPARALVPTTKANRRLHKVLAEYRALGWTQSQQAAVAQKARDIHHMKRTYQRWSMHLGVKANKLQRHFRVQLNM